jgi:hypothetical protein
MPAPHRGDDFVGVLCPLEGLGFWQTKPLDDFGTFVTGITVEHDVNTLVGRDLVLDNLLATKGAPGVAAPLRVFVAIVASGSVRQIFL